LIRRAGQIASSLISTCVACLLVPAVSHAAEYQLDIRKEIVNITGKPLERVTVNHSLPAPTLYWTEGEDVVVHVTNHMKEPSSVHWHGILLPGEMDGVKGLNNYPGIEPGKTFTYRFTVRQNGTYWYHSHTNGQEQDGLYGALIIHPKSVRPKSADPVKAHRLQNEREHVVMFSDFSEETSDQILGNLKMTSDYYNNSRRTVGDFFQDVHENGFKLAWQHARDWGVMRMSPTDLADVSGYTFLVNGKTPDQNWTGIFKPGETVRLHMINASAMSFYDVRILDSEKKRLKMTVVQADGRNVEPVPVDEFRFGVAETYDVLVTPTEAKAYTIVAEPIDRSGFAIGTLAPQEGMKGLMPEQRPRALLTMDDMGGMDMSGMDKSKMSKEEWADMMKQMRSGWAKTGAPRGDKVLSYADLKFLGEQQDTRPEEREIKVTLGGNMERYIWTMDGKTEMEAKPIALRFGERVKLTFINETMMAHPMHLHGMFVQLNNGQPAAKLPDKTVVIVPPGKSYSVLLTADEPGEWSFHCHLLYHMASGMMNKVVVATLDEKNADDKNLALPATPAAHTGGGHVH
jgi:FtsP/CotA-like multicopper oxidase with cupredoxin domain